MNQPAPHFQPPNALERIFNRVFGHVVGLGLLRDYYLLEVRGRRTGRFYSTPVNVVAVTGKRFLVAPRGHTQWVRNAEAAGEVSLKQGRSTNRFRIHPPSAAQK